MSYIQTTLSYDDERPHRVHGAIVTSIYAYHPHGLIPFVDFEPNEESYETRMRRRRFLVCYFAMTLGLNGAVMDTFKELLWMTKFVYVCNFLYPNILPEESLTQSTVN